MPIKVYTAHKIFTGKKWLADYAIVVEGGLIKELLPIALVEKGKEIKRFEEHFLVPAFIDLQLYGAHKKLLAVYPQPETLALINDYCRAGGAALCLPTIATNRKEVFYQGIDAVNRYWQQGGKGVWGLHFEGPWINKEKRGAHIEELIHAPSVEEVTELLTYGKDVIKMITLAPEVCSDEVIALIQSQNIIISAGHSNAGYTEAIRAFDKGIKVVTHLYNAMSPLQHRAPGLVGAVLAHNKVRASIIADGYHVDFAAIKIAKSIMQERLFVITDAVTETTNGPYQHQFNGNKYECDGILSGSALTMHQSFLNLVHKVAIEIEEALRMCSLYPAQVLGCDHLYGQIAPGCAAQFVSINKQLEMVELITV